MVPCNDSSLEAHYFECLINSCVRGRLALWSVRVVCFSVRSNETIGSFFVAFGVSIELF